MLYLPPNKNLGGEGSSYRYTPAAKYLYWSIFKKSRHLGFVWSLYSVSHSRIMIPVMTDYAKGVHYKLTTAMSREPQDQRVSPLNTLEMDRSKYELITFIFGYRQAHNISAAI